MRLVEINIGKIAGKKISAATQRPDTKAILPSVIGYRRIRGRWPGIAASVRRSIDIHLEDSAARLINHYGSEEALDLIDERANRASNRGDYETARRWRTLITAIHAIENDEPLPGDKRH